MSKGKFLITDKVHQKLIHGLLGLDFAVDYKPNISQPEISIAISECVGIVIATRIKLKSDELKNANSLKWILRAGSGMENVDVELAARKGITCINSPEGNRDAVGEHTLGLLISLFHNIPASFGDIQNGNWSTEKFRVNELQGNTIAIIGYGNTGSAFAQRLQGMNVKVLAYDKYVPKFTNSFAESVSLNTIFNEADVISFHLPLTNETRSLVDRQFIMQFRKPIYLINTSRGEVVDEVALLEAVESKKIISAALDVITDENSRSQNLLKDELIQKMLSTNRIIITPHIAGKSNMSKEQFADVLLQKLVDKM